MKLYDYCCADCGESFEELVQEVSDARCPACTSSRVEKQMSAFAVGGSGPSERAAQSPCGMGPCRGDGSCGRS
jgi:putative FmdB family regulatory protein